jgi:erythromycin esterase
MPKPKTSIATLLCICSLIPACGGGGDGASVPSTPPVGATANPDLTLARLLTDAELATPPLPNSVTAPSAIEGQWLRDNTKAVRSLVVDTDFSDLAFLDKEVAGKRIVQLGESSHGTREFNLMKVRLIKYMHEKLGYDVLAFESSLIACHLQNKELPSTALTPKEMTRRCTFPVWQTEEVSELFRYVKSTQTTAKPLQIAGFDIQYSGELDQADPVVEWMLSLTNTVDPNTSATVSTALRRILSIAQSSDNAAISITTTAAPILELLKSGAARASADKRPDFETAMLALKALQDRHTYVVEYTRDGNDQKTRERGMADALTGLAEKVYPNAKIMTWAHNAHIAAHVEFYPRVQPMGAYLKQTWGDQLFTLGLFMLRGENVVNFRTRVPVQVLAPGRGSLEEIAYSLRLAAAYIPINRNNEATAGDDWQHRVIPFRSWGTVDHQDALSTNFNGVIVVDHSSVPRYN